MSALMPSVAESGTRLDTATRSTWPPATRIPGDAESLAVAARSATRAAALACLPFVGRGDGKGADAAATNAMRLALADAPGVGTVVIGEGEKDEAPMLYRGERMGRGGAPAYDIGVDPLECTDFAANGLGGAMATIAVSEPGSLWSGAGFYMDKIVVRGAARDAIDIADTPERNLARIAEALERSVAELHVVILDKPRHVELIARVRATGASVSTPAGGDVAGSLSVLLPSGNADVLLGIGGSPEGVLTACATRALGGGMQARTAPQSDAEAQALRRAGVEPGRPLGLDELASSDACVFTATGVTSGAVLRGPWTVESVRYTESLVIAGGTVEWVIECDAFGRA